MINIATKISVDGVDYLAEVGKAEELYLGFEDHGMFMLNIDFSFGSHNQGLGRSLIELQTLKDIINVFGVREWSQIQGKSIYVLRQGQSLSSIINGFVSLDGKRQFLFE